MIDLLKLFLVVTLLTLVVNGELFDKYKVVETSNGKIRGILNTTFLNGISFYSFKGIPYAKPPIGDLRFKPPKPADSWKPSIFNANQFGNICLQGQSPFLSTLPASEDCLTLNIFVPLIPVKNNPDICCGRKLSVLIFIHGGLFKSGSGDDFMYGPDFIMEKQTILVTLNYRLGALGFLALDSKEISGNMGLKDQQLALKWIYSNIGGFGGDNKRITMIGQSVGGVSATYHVLNTDSRKYIRHSIPMSGSTANVWAMAKEKNNLKLAFRMAKEIGGKELNSYDELVEFLKKVPAEKLIPYNGDFSPIHDLVEIIFGPVVERRDADQPFLLEYPEKLYESTKIVTDTNFLFTICDVESLSVLPKRTPEFFAQLNANFSDHIRLPFRGFDIDYKSDGFRDLANEIRRFYFGNRVLDVSLEYDYFKFTSDLNWVYVVDESVRNVSKILKGKAYYAWFAVDSTLNVWKKQKPPFPAEMSKYPGAGHGDDVCFIFKCGVAQKRYDEIIRNKNNKQSKICLQTIEYITTLITNMAKYGNPTHQNNPIAGFPPVKNEKIPFLITANDGLSIGINPRQKTINFWNYIKQKAFQLSFAKKLNRQICFN